MSGTASAKIHPTAFAYHAEVGLTPLSEEKRRVLAWVGRAQRVLEVGAHTGFLTAHLSEQECDVTAVEIDARAARAAQSHAARVVVGDYEDAATRRAVGGAFDVALFPHVLEHMVDPWAALQATRSLLVPDGRLIVLLPNVASWVTRKTLFFQGRFDYQDTGILDRTHLRFFTLDSAMELIEATGFDLLATELLDANVPLARRLRGVPGVTRWRRWMVRRYPNLCAEVLLLVGQPRAEAR